MVTGGTGTLGTALCESLLASDYRVRTLSRSEDKRAKLKKAFPDVSVLAGDVCDLDRLMLSFRGVDVVIHAAALKRIDLCEADPIETQRVNVLGTQNVIQACVLSGVKKAILISTDKACSPSTLYGATKLNAERAWLSANVYAGGGYPHFMALRYGNVFGSAGSVIHAFTDQMAKGRLTLTDPNASRFHITLKEAVGLVRMVMGTGYAGELHIPKLPSYRLEDLATAFMEEYSAYDWQPHAVCGLRASEKRHELLISVDECESVIYDGKDGYVLAPGRVANPGARWVYSSDGAQTRLTVDELRKLIRENSVSR